MSEQGKLHQRSKDYAKLPAKLMHDQSITDGAKVLYCHMHWRYGNNHKNFESLKSMAKQLGVSDQTIANRIRELEATEWVVTIERRQPEKGNYTSNFYHVFEVQGEARKFRDDYEIVEGETLRTLPESRVRKSRKGKGGKPENLTTVPTQVGQSIPTQLGQEAIPTQVGAVLPTQVGTIHTHSIQSQGKATTQDATDGIEILPLMDELDELITAWLKAAGKHAPLDYSLKKCREYAAQMVVWKRRPTPDDVYGCTVERCKGRTIDYHFKYLLDDLPGWFRIADSRQRQAEQEQTEQEQSEAYRKWYRQDVLGRPA